MDTPSTDDDMTAWLLKVNKLTHATAWGMDAISQGWKPIAEFYNNRVYETDKGAPFYELLLERGHRAVAQYALFGDYDDDYRCWQKRNGERVLDDHPIVAYRKLITLDDPGMQDAIAHFKRELEVTKRENGGTYTAERIVKLMDKFFPNWYIKDVGMPGIEMSELQEALTVTFKFDFKSRT